MEASSLSSSKQPPPLLDLRDEEDDEEDPRPLQAPPSTSEPSSALLQQQQQHPDGPPSPSLGHDDGGSHGMRDHHQVDHQLLQPRGSAEARPAALTGTGGGGSGGGGGSSSSHRPPQPLSVMMGPASSMLQRLFGTDIGASSLNDGPSSSGLTTRLLQDEDEDEEDGGMLVLPLSASRCCPWPVLGEWVLWFLLALLLTALLGTSGAAPSLAVVVLGVLPNAFLLVYLCRRFNRSVLWAQGWSTFLEAVLWMCPIVVAENLWDYVLIAVTKLPTAPPPTGEEGGAGEEAYNPDCGPCVLSAFLVSYTVAGFFEELVKFMAIRRLLHQPHVTHPAALLVYAAWAGSAFEIVENLTLYDVRYGVGTAVVRALTPLHALTAMLIGAALARRRFIDRCPPDPPTASSSSWFCSSWWQPWRRWHLGVLLVPTAIHGSFDFLLSILPTTTSPAAQAAALLLPLAIVALTYLYLRHRINEELLHALPIELLDVPLAVEAGTIDKRALPSRRRLLLLAVLAPLTTLIFYAIISQLVPPHYHHYTWGRRMRLIDSLLAPLSAG